MRLSAREEATLDMNTDTDMYMEVTAEVEVEVEVDVGWREWGGRSTA